jgi:hypothetical protein
MDGVTHTVSEVIAILQAEIDTRSDLSTKRAAVKTALAARKNATAARIPVERGLAAWVVARFGAGSQEAHDFGYAPAVRHGPTIATKAQALAKSNATRVARGTRGSRQKADIHGEAAPPAAPVTASAVGEHSGATPAGTVASAPTHS